VPGAHAYGCEQVDVGGCRVWKKKDFYFALVETLEARMAASVSFTR